MLSSKESSKSSVRPFPTSMPWILLLFVSLFLSECVVNAEYAAHEYGSLSHAASQFHLTIENLQRLARIANAAYVQTKISSRMLSTDAFIAEILHLENVWPNDIAGMDQSQFDGVVKELETLSKNLPTSQDATEIEQRLILLEEMAKNAEYFKHFAEFPGKIQFKNDLTKVEEVKTIDYDEFKRAAFSFLINFKTAKSLPQVDANNVDQAVGRMAGILASLYDLEKSARSFENEKLKEAKTITEHPNFFDILIPENGHRKLLDGFQYEKQAMLTVQKNFHTLITTSKKVDKLFLTFRTIKSLIPTRDKEHYQFYQYTSGFPSGTFDLKQLSDSINHKFIRKYVPKSQLVMDKLRSAFNPYLRLTETLEDLERVWSKILGENGSNVTDYIEKVDKVASICKEFKPITQLADEVKKCHENVNSYPSSIPVTMIKTTWNSINNLTTAIKSISGFKTVPDFIDLASLKSVFDYRGKTPEETIKFVQKALDELESPRMKEFEGKVAKLYEDLENLDKVMELYGTLKFEWANLDVYYENFLYTKVYINMYSCLANVTTRAPSIKEAFETIRSAREFSLAMKTRNSFREFIKSREHIPIIKSAAEKLRNKKNRETSILVSIFKKKKYLTASENLGKGVRGLLAVEKLYAARDKFKPLIANAEDVLKNDSLSQEQMQELSKLANLRGLFESIDEFLRKKFVDFRRRRVEHFDTYSEVFEEATKIRGVKIDLKALESLHKSDPDRFPAPIDELKTLGLDFSSFRFDKAAYSLTVIDQFFVEFAEGLLAAESIPGDSKRGYSPAKPKDLTAFERYYEKHAIDFWHAVVFVIGAVITSIVIICCRRRGNCMCD